MRDTEQSGTFSGHAIPAVCFGGFGVFFLVLSLKRARTLPPGQSFCETHVPEKSTTLLKKVAIVVLSLATFGVFFEQFGPFIVGHRKRFRFLTDNAAHDVLYISFGSIAPIMLMEASSLVPPDSSRAMLALALVLSFVLWNEHALMKDDPTDNRVHALLANLCLVHAATMALSIFQPFNLVFYIAGWGLFVMQAAWLITAGINTGLAKISRELVGPIFCLEIVIVTLSIVLIGVCFCRQPKNNGDMEKGPLQKHEHERLVMSEMDETNLVSSKL